MRNLIAKPYDNLFDMEHETLVLKPAGQAQNEESMARQRSFADRAQAIETLKKSRLRSVQLAKAGAPMPRKRKSGNPA